MQRKLRVWPELPPRHSRGADSSSITLAPASRAIKAAHSAALPPPITKTSKVINTFRAKAQGTKPESDQNWYLRKPPSTGITAPVM